MINIRLSIKRFFIDIVVSCITHKNKQYFSMHVRYKIFAGSSASVKSRSSIKKNYFLIRDASMRHARMLTLSSTMCREAQVVKLVRSVEHPMNAVNCIAPMNVHAPIQFIGRLALAQLETAARTRRRDDDTGVNVV